MVPPSSSRRPRDCSVADYLAGEVQLEGIIYPSVQTREGKRNVVLFHKAPRVDSR
jgi:hypothetical protein